MSKTHKIPSPCVDICKDKHGVCIACGRSKSDQRAWKDADTRDEKLALIARCAVQTGEVGTRVFWEREYRRKCQKKGVPCPLDRLHKAAS